MGLFITADASTCAAAASTASAASCCLVLPPQTPAAAIFTATSCRPSCRTACEDSNGQLRLCGLLTPEDAARKSPEFVWAGGVPAGCQMPCILRCASGTIDPCIFISSTPYTRPPASALQLSYWPSGTASTTGRHSTLATAWLGGRTTIRCPCASGRACSASGPTSLLSYSSCEFNNAMPVTCWVERRHALCHTGLQLPTAVAGRLGTAVPAAPAVDCSGLLCPLASFCCHSSTTQPPACCSTPRAANCPQP